MNECINCKTREFLEVFENPWNNRESIILCYKCARTPFDEFNNKEFMKPWWEKNNGKTRTS